MNDGRYRNTGWLGWGDLSRQLGNDSPQAVSHQREGQAALYHNLLQVTGQTEAL